MSSDKNYDSVATRWWQRLDGHSIQCRLCPHQCHLEEGQRGFCGVRINQDNRMVSLTYGCISSLCVDPIEKKPLYHFYPGSQVLSIGSIGCNLKCCFCQNWSIAHAENADGLKKIDDLSFADLAIREKCRSVAFTYNEPIVSAEYVIDVFKECRKKDIKTVAVTNGYIDQQAREDFFRYVDAVNVDLKSFSDDFYAKICQGRLQPVLDTLRYLLKKTKVWVEITMLVIPGKNDSDQEINAMTQWVRKNLAADIPIHFSAFYPNFRMLDVSATPLEALHHIRKIAMNNGLRFVYTGNVPCSQGTSTICSSCGQVIVVREGYRVSCDRFENARCSICYQEIPGFFEYEK